MTNVDAEFVGLLVTGAGSLITPLAFLARWQSKKINELQDKISKQSDTFNKEIDTKTDALHKVNAELIETKAFLEIETRRADSVESQNELLRSQHSQILSRLGDVEAEATTLRRTVDEQKPKLDELESLLKQNKENQETIIKQNKMITDLIAERDALKAERDALLQKIEDVETKNAEVIKKLTDDNAKIIRDLQEQIDDLQKQINAQTESVAIDQPQPDDQ
jgi:chromosome segregation ATPase